MTEDTHYYLKISPKEQSGFFDASIRCGKCNVPIAYLRKMAHFVVALTHPAILQDISNAVFSRKRLSTIPF